MNTGFAGFPQEMFKFLDELAAHNNRAWFADNKSRYDGFVVQPVTRFIEAVGLFMPAISESFVADTRRNGGSMFRIYRDTRFSRDKRPYKENVGCQFRHTAGRDAHAPGFYVHLSPREVFIGGGIWKPAAPAMDKIRMAISGKPGAWSGVLGEPSFLEYYGGLADAGRLKRPPKGYNAQHVHIDDLKRTDFIALRHVEPGLALQPSFIKEVERAFMAASPVMRFLTGALELSY